MRGAADRDARKHMITIVYEIKTSPDAEPNAADDALTANWYDISEILTHKEKFAFDHHSILSEYVAKFHAGKL